MGLTVLEIEVGNPADPEVTERVEFLIDSGAIYSVVPTPVLQKLGIKPLAEEEFRLANGTKVVREKGIALFRYGERVGGADVIFGEEGDYQLLGALTLGALGLALDPLKRELKPLPRLLATVRNRWNQAATWATGETAPEVVRFRCHSSHTDSTGARAATGSSALEDSPAIEVRDIVKAVGPGLRQSVASEGATPNEHR